MSHLDREVLTVQRLHLVQSISLELLGLDPHCHLQHPDNERDTDWFRPNSTAGSPVKMKDYSDEKELAFSETSEEALALSMR